MLAIFSSSSSSWLLLLLLLLLLSLFQLSSSLSSLASTPHLAHPPSPSPTFFFPCLVSVHLQKGPRTPRRMPFQGRHQGERGTIKPPAGDLLGEDSGDINPPTSERTGDSNPPTNQGTGDITPPTPTPTYRRPRPVHWSCPLPR